MKKLIVFFIIISVALASKSVKTELIDRMARLFFDKKEIYLYINDSTYKVDKNFGSFVVVDSCEKADFCIVKDIDSLPKKCIDGKSYVLATTYKDFNKNENILGAMFWQKGRLNLIFREKRLKDLHLTLPRQYDKFIE